MIGYLGDDALAYLLPDTNAAGAQVARQKVIERAKGLSVSISTGTYPDNLFDSLLSDSGDLPDTHPMLLEVAPDSVLQLVVKRAMDVFGSLLAIALFSPVMLVTAVLVAATSPGPVIFRQIRLGKGCVPFTFYKFRSMSVNADDSIHREYVANLIDGNHYAVNQGDTGNPYYKIKSDPRVTRIGRIIRATSIDELPQLFNVLKGDMSLVGPRPPLPYEAEKYQSWHLRRVLEIRPGITGLWQVEGRSKTSFDEMVRLDLRYIKNCSPLLDLKILLRTVAVVLRRDGAT